ncbi:MAG: phosphoribosylglycinamide formyltransferase [Pacificimonas sp.]|jgi:phosphoribosylglycinamide formyltransferase-1|nr:phosphoribosylglycinamide formyltransferase [Pacificimonas sp.]
MSDARPRVAALISGRGSNMAALLYHSRLDVGAFDLCLVAANDPGAEGLKLAQSEGIPIWSLAHKGLSKAEFEGKLEDALEESRTDYIALSGFMRVLSAEFVQRWAGRILNIHPSLLPKYKGLDTHRKALDAGDSHGGCSVHIVTPELDDGPVLAQMPVAIAADDTAESLAARVLRAEHQLYPVTLNAYVSRFRDSDWLLDQLRMRALELERAEEATSHGAPAFRVTKGKFFAHFSDRHHGVDRVALLAKTSGEDEMNALIEAEPDLYHRPAYYGASGWIGIRLDRPDTDWDHVAEWLRTSWRRTAPKSLTKLIDAAEEF